MNDNDKSPIVNAGHFLKLVTTLVELAEPVSPGKQVLVGFGFHIVAETIAENLSVPNIHIGKYLLHLRVEHKSSEPIGQIPARVDFV